MKTSFNPLSAKFADTFLKFLLLMLKKGLDLFNTKNYTDFIIET